MVDVAGNVHELRLLWAAFDQCMNQMGRSSNKELLSPSRVGFSLFMHILR